MRLTDVTARFAIPRIWPRLAMSVGAVDAIVVHHTVTLYLAKNATVEDELNQIAVIHRYHRESRGFLGFGYHFIVFPSGRAYHVVPLTQMGAHVWWRNDHLWGLAFAGDFTDRLPGEPQIAGGRECVQFCFTAKGAELPIGGHGSYGETTCPGRLSEILQKLTPEQEENEMLVIQGSGDAQYAWNGGPTAIHLTREELEALRPHDYRRVPQSLINKLAIVSR